VPFKIILKNLKLLSVFVLMQGFPGGFGFLS
jgi:hypothetical protein